LVGTASQVLTEKFMKLRIWGLVIWQKCTDVSEGPAANITGAVDYSFTVIMLGMALFFRNYRSMESMDYRSVIEEIGSEYW